MIVYRSSSVRLWAEAPSVSWKATLPPNEGFSRCVLLHGVKAPTCYLSLSTQIVWATSSTSLMVLPVAE
eukprot:c41419_g1_i1 orf=61-267(+)